MGGSAEDKKGQKCPLTRPVTTCADIGDGKRICITISLQDCLKAFNHPPQSASEKEKSKPKCSSSCADYKKADSGAGEMKPTGGGSLTERCKAAVAGCERHNTACGKIGPATEIHGKSCGTGAPAGGSHGKSCGTCAPSGGSHGKSCGTCAPAGGSHGTQCGIGAPAGGGHGTQCGTGATAGGGHGAQCGTGAPAGGVHGAQCGTGAPAGGSHGKSCGTCVPAGGSHGKQCGTGAPAGGSHGTQCGTGVPAGGSHGKQCGTGVPAGGSHGTQCGTGAQAGGSHGTQCGTGAPAGGSHGTQCGTGATAGGSHSPQCGTGAPAGGSQRPSCGSGGIRGSQGAGAVCGPGAGNQNFTCGPARPGVGNHGCAGQGPRLGSQNFSCGTAAPGVGSHIACGTCGGQRPGSGGSSQMLDSGPGVPKKGYQQPGCNYGPCGTGGGNQGSGSSKGGTVGGNQGMSCRPPTVTQRIPVSCGMGSMRGGNQGFNSGQGGNQGSSCGTGGTTERTQIFGDRPCCTVGGNQGSSRGAAAAANPSCCDSGGFGLEMPDYSCPPKDECKKGGIFGCKPERGPGFCVKKKCEKPDCTGAVDKKEVKACSPGEIRTCGSEGKPKGCSNIIRDTSTDSDGSPAQLEKSFIESSAQSTEPQAIFVSQDQLNPQMPEEDSKPIISEQSLINAQSDSILDGKQETFTPKNQGDAASEPVINCSSEQYQPESMDSPRNVFKENDTLKNSQLNDTPSLLEQGLSKLLLLVRTYNRPKAPQRTTEEEPDIERDHIPGCPFYEQE